MMRAGGGFFTTVIFAGLLALFTGAAAAEPLDVSNDLRELNLTQHTEIFADKTAKLTYADVTSGEAASRFATPSTASIRGGYTTAALWLKIHLRNPSSMAFSGYIEFPMAWIDGIDLYEKTVGGVAHRHYGVSLPYSQREVDTPAHFIPLSIPPGETVEIAVRLECQDGLTFAPYLHGHSSGEARIIFNTTFNAIIIGAMLVMALYNLFIFFSLRDMNYLAYVAYLFGIMLFCGIYYGFDYQFFWPESPHFNKQMGVASTCLAMLMSIAFSRGFLHTRQNLPKTDVLLRVLIFFIILAIVGGFSPIPHFYASNFTTVVGGVYGITLMAVSFLALRKKIPAAGFYVLAWMFGIIGSVAASMMVQGYADYSHWFHELSGITFMLDMAILSLALADRINHSRREKEEAQRRALEHEKWALEVMQRAKEKLEEKVLERTAELSESENRFRQLTEGGFEGVVIHENGAIKDYNRQICELTGYAPEELIDKSIFSFISPESRQKVALASESGSEEPLEMQVMRKDGTLVATEVRGKSITTGGRTQRIVAVRDITEHKLAEREIISAKEMAENATKLKDKFVSLVSHDLRSPMATAMGLLGLVERDGNQKLDEAKRAEMISKARKSLGGLVEMIDQLLDLSRLQTGNMSVVKRIIDVRQVVALSLERCAPSAEKKGVRLVNETPANMKVLADNALVGEVLNNLVSNAVKFCRAGDSIIIGSADSLTITVKDTGAGIPTKTLPDLFKPEVKTSTIGTDGEKGTGLGLPYCKEIMAAHNGDLTVESVEGKGTVFFMKFPAKRPVVLIADDHEVQRAIIKKYVLEVSDVEVVEACNGLQALAVLKTTAVALLITDLGMPEMDGFALLKEIRSNPLLHALPIIVNSAASGSSVIKGETIDHRRRALELGANDFIAKPVVPEDFFPRVARYLG
jgi:PAS domain S-box-containing protein